MLLIQAFGLHAHGHSEEGEDDGHDHGTASSSGEESSQEYIWKGCLVLLGIYAFYLLEVTLHGMGDYLKKVS